MFSLLFEFFYNLFYLGYASTEHVDILDGILDSSFILPIGTAQVQFDSMGEYFAFICSIISLIFILILCCLFVYKIIKLVGNLIR